MYSCLLIARCPWRRKNTSLLLLSCQSFLVHLLPAPFLPILPLTIEDANCWLHQLQARLRDSAPSLSSLHRYLVYFSPSGHRLLFFPSPFFFFSQLFICLPSPLRLHLRLYSFSPPRSFPLSLCSLCSFSFTACPWTHSSFPDTFTLLPSPLPLSVYHSANLHGCVYNLDVTRHFLITGHKEKLMEGKEKWTTEYSLSLHTKWQLGWIS